MVFRRLRKRGRDRARSSERRRLGKAFQKDGPTTAKLLRWAVASLTLGTTRSPCSAEWRDLAFWFRPGFGYGRNSKFSFGIVTASRNSDNEFGKHGIILQPFPNPVSACPYAKLASSGSGVA